MEGYERLSRVKICAACGGQGKTRRHYNHYHVDVDCEDCDGEGTYKLETVAALIQKSKDVKAKAAALFKQGSAGNNSAKYKEADDMFAQGLALIAPFRVGAEATSLRVALLLNRAACSLKCKEWQTCVDHCEIVLKKDETNVKALWRSSVSFGELGNIEQSKELLVRMLAKEPTHSLGLEALQRLEDEEIQISNPGTRFSRYQCRC
jgi:hypothetical protein